MKLENIAYVICLTRRLVTALAQCLFSAIRVRILTLQQATSVYTILVDV